MQDAAVKGETAAKAATGRKERRLLPMTHGMMVMNVPGNPDGEETEAGVVMQDIPGRGGDGGNGGIVKVFVLDASLPRVNAWGYIVNGGKRGEAGDPGTRGEGGTGGPQGDQNDPCPARSEYAGSDGPPGRSMSEIDPLYESNFEGEDGKDGDWSAHSMSVLPQ